MIRTIRAEMTLLFALVAACLSSVAFAVAPLSGLESMETSGSGMETLQNTLTLHNTLQNAWEQTTQQAAELTVRYGLKVIVALVLFGVYSFLLFGVSRAIWAVVRRILPTDAQKLARKTLKITMRLTLWMLVLVSSTALFPSLSRFGPAIFQSYLLLLVLYLGWGGIQRLLDMQKKRWDLDSSLTLLITNTIRSLWITLGLYMFFQQFGVNLLPVLGGLGIVGLALGVAAQDILANLVSGIVLLLDRPFRIGDWIRVVDQEGQVIGITLRTTRIRTRENEFMSIPNKEIAGSTVINLSEGGPLRLFTPVGIAYHENVPAARSILLDMLQKQTDILTQPVPEVWVKDLSGSSVDLVMRYWIAGEHIAIRPMIDMQVREQAKAVLQEAQIDIPFPHLQLHIDGAKGLEKSLEKSLENILNAQNATQNTLPNGKN